jgi:hypothetical protein
MKNNLVRLKLKQRLNKLSSSDFTNLECWQEAELINKAAKSIVRSTIRDKDEANKISVDDIQVLLREKDLKLSNKKVYFESEDIPEEYFGFKKVVVEAESEKCKIPKRIRCVLVEEANVEFLLEDYLRSPSFEWGETFCTLFNNKIRIWTNNEFIVKNCKLSYYKTPDEIRFDGCRDYDDKLMSDQELEFKDDLVEIIIDEAVSIAAADMGDFNNFQRSKSTSKEFA